MHMDEAMPRSLHSIHNVPVNISLVKDDQLVSRSHAKRILNALAPLSEHFLVDFSVRANEGKDGIGYISGDEFKGPSPHVK